MKKWLCLLLAGALLCSLAACYRGKNVDNLKTLRKKREQRKEKFFE